jgi:hypothetical protein
LDNGILSLKRGITAAGDFKKDLLKTAGEVTIESPEIFFSCAKDVRKTKVVIAASMVL